MQYRALIQIKTNNTFGTVYTKPAAEQSTYKRSSVYQREVAKFKIKHKSRCLQKSKLVDLGRGKHVDWGGRPLWPPFGADLESTPSGWATELKI